VITAADVADFGDQADGGDKGDAAQGLECVHDRWA
jgi:hypothetical protein